MPVDVYVEVGLHEGADVADAYDMRQALDASVIDTKVRGVGGGTSFDPLVVDADYESPTTRDAMTVVGTLTTVLLERGYAVRTREGGLLQYVRVERDGFPALGEAFIRVVAPLGMPA